MHPTIARRRTVHEREETRLDEGRGSRRARLTLDTHRTLGTRDSLAENAWARGVVAHANRGSYDPHEGGASTPLRLPARVNSKPGERNERDGLADIGSAVLGEP